MKHTLTDPLILSDTKYGYKVNKPLQYGQQSLVSLQVAEEIIGALNDVLANTAWNNIEKNSLTNAQEVLRKYKNHDNI